MRLEAELAATLTATSARRLLASTAVSPAGEVQAQSMKTVVFLMDVCGAQKGGMMPYASPAVRRRPYPRLHMACVSPMSPGHVSGPCPS